MTKPMIRIHNTETNEIIDREMTDEEFASYEAEAIAYENSFVLAASKAIEKAALLEKLGITDDEAKLLLS